ncbi:MAG: ABC transporter ATP-binding protein [Deltaproteobacteria bacterium]|nr:ABC transporter ATP-binding protein [Deltaproteobacteria bacterium]MBW1956116.1 ABC transporter ATP-binding protein [Deltaproteobacteria bacterium]MBW2041847.1 ABC transporter ATP-binding protein [Deltaproteobacteria bacterium]MBW2133062.1 ABC transporter ATP-binding protein [Deltaproteobacteria bacterium]
MIVLNRLTKRYTKTLAVNDLSLAVPKGEIFGFIGPNGAGKTTTIKMMAGLMAPTSGSVSICGIDMAENPREAKARIGFIPDRPYLYEKLTGMEFLKFIARVYGMVPDGFKEKAQFLLDRFALADWADDLIEAYSHGMCQRLVMVAALLHDPEVIIVDEPMVGLDPVAVILVKRIFRELAEKGVTLFVSTHSLGVAQDVCHRIGIIHRGRLIATGSLDQLRERARAADADLEAVFMALTAENSNPM